MNEPKVQELALNQVSSSVGIRFLSAFLQTKNLLHGYKIKDKKLL